MKKVLAKLPGGKRQLVIQKRYRTAMPLISIGCDCHPAQVLKTLGMRKMSFPFDWLGTPPARGIDYVNSNIETEFANFILDLTENQCGNLVSEHYPETEFMHYGDLTHDIDRQQQMVRRAKRFLDFYHNQKCAFLYNLSSVGLGTAREVEGFLDSVNKFHRLSGGRHQLHVYIRFDESGTENSERCGMVESMLTKTDNTRVAKYVRHKSKFGIWGDPNDYLSLLKSLGVRPTVTLPHLCWENR